MVTSTYAPSTTYNSTSNAKFMRLSNRAARFTNSPSSSMSGRRKSVVEPPPEEYVVMKQPPFSAQVQVKLTDGHPGSQSSGNIRLKSSIKSSTNVCSEHEEPMVISITP